MAGRSKWSQGNEELQVWFQSLDLLFRAAQEWFYKPGVPNLQDLMSDDLRWSWCDNNTYKLKNKCNHPETIAPNLVQGKSVYHETCPWCQKGWSLLHRPPASEILGEGVTMQVSRCVSNLLNPAFGRKPRNLHLFKYYWGISGKVRNTGLGQHFPIWGYTKLPRNLVNYTEFWDSDYFNRSQLGSLIFILNLGLDDH